MTKAILIVDMPNNCKECPFFDDEIIVSCWANMGFKARTIVHDEKERQHYCPLKPMPENKEELYYPHGEYKIAVNEGYNRCVEEILGEEDGR